MKTSDWNEAQESFADYLERCWTQQLMREARDIFAYYRLPMPIPMLNLNDDSTLYGCFDANRYLVSISRHLIKNHSWDLVIEILKHELAHVLVFHRGLSDDSAHGKNFQEACHRLGVAPWARHASIELDPLAAIAQHRQLAADEARLLQKVEKLLSLASSSNEHEAALAMQRARELCARHHLEALLARKKSTFTYIVINHRKRQIPTFQWSILHILTQYFYVNSVSRGLYDPQERVQHRIIDIMGTQENVQMAEYAYWFLYNQLPILFEQFRKSKNVAPRNARNSFYLGVLRGFADKLKAQQQEFKTKTREWGLIASEEDRLGLERISQDELREFVRNRFPSIVGGSGRGLQVSADAYSSGKERGRELNLNRGLHQTHSGPVHQLK